MSTTPEPTTYELQEFCKVCGRVRWGNYQYLFKGQWRHESCYPGSKEWCEYYENLPVSEQTDAGDLIYQNS